MTARQFWNEHFPNKKATIFEVMEAYREHAEQNLKKKLDDKLQTAEAARIEAQTNVKSLLLITNGQKEEIARIKKEFENYKDDVRDEWREHNERQDYLRDNPITN